MIKTYTTFFLSLFFLSFCHFSYSQNTISGIVINGIDNGKLSAASVFINNSSKGTFTAIDGTFSIDAIRETNFELVISYTGFETISLKVTPENIHSIFSIKLFPRENELREIKITSPQKNGWKEWGTFFTKSFLGASDFALECKIINPEVLRFYYDKQNQILSAYSHGNLIIHNRALGYNIRYQLEEFRYDGKNKIITYIGYTGFEDLNLNKNRNKWTSNRREAYRGSLLHFMRSVYANTIATEGFILREKVKVFPTDSAFKQIFRNGNLVTNVVIDSNQYFSVAGPKKALSNFPEYIDLFNKKIFEIAKAVASGSENQKSFYFLNYMQVVYKNAKEKNDYLKHLWRPLGSSKFQTSEINLVMDEPILIEQNGVYFNPINVITSGYWGWCKMAETLPIDYIENSF